MKEKPTDTKSYIKMHPKWEPQLTAAYQIIKDFPFEEQIKWGAPCFTYKNVNLVGLTAFKNHCAIWFHKGALLEDSKCVLVNAQPGKTKLLRQLRFRESEMPDPTLLKNFLTQIIEIEIKEQ